jgi:hypothetical protein
MNKFCGPGCKNDFLVVVDRNRTAVPVPDEPQAVSKSRLQTNEPKENGEARESKLVRRSDALGAESPLSQNSRGGSQTISPNCGAGSMSALKQGGENISVETQITSKQSEASRQAKIEELRGLMNNVSKEPTVKSQTPLVYRNDFGGVISKYAWEQLQKKKEAAKKGNYTLDEYSQ